MPRRSGFERTVDDLSSVFPWWALLALAPVAYAAMRFGLPLIDMGHPILVNVMPTLAGFAWLPAVVLVIASIVSFLKAHARRRLLERQRGIESIRELSWREFEQLVGEAYRRQGYAVTETGQAGADGGVDLALRRDGESVVVQCKRWRSRSIGVPVVRELLGAVTAAKATRGVVVGSGTFTAPAITFARENGIELVDGAGLARLVADVQAEGGRVAGTSGPRAAVTLVAPPEPLPAEAEEQTEVAACAACGSPMVERVARRGAKAGQCFLGCSRYPACRATRDL